MITVLNQNLMSGLTQSERLVAEYEVTGAAVSSVTISGLDILADGGYKVIAHIVSAASSLSYINWGFNGDITTNNKKVRYIYTAGTSIATVEVTSPSMDFNGITSVGHIGYTVADVSFVNGNVVVNMSVIRNNFTEAILNYELQPITESNVTSLTIFNVSNANAVIGIGSKISIYRKH